MILCGCGNCLIAVVLCSHPLVVRHVITWYASYLLLCLLVTHRAAVEGEWQICERSVETKNEKVIPALACVVTT